MNGRQISIKCDREMQQTAFLGKVTTHLSVVPWSRFIPFLFAAGLSVPVNIGSRILLSLVCQYEFAVVASHLLGMAVAFTLNKVIVFSPSGRKLWSEFGRFAAVNALSLTQTWMISVGLVRLAFPLVGFEFHPELIAHIIGLALSSLTSFWGHSRYSFASA
jgi:putative flippase GtrA